MSRLFLVGDRVYKCKKPVALDFLDFTDPETRERVCHREVELNRRLAPDVYLGVATLHDVDGTTEPFVVMRRMPEERRLSTLVRRGVDVTGCVREVARTVAAFHTRAETSPEIASAGSPDAVRANWESGFATMRPFAGPLLDPRLTDEIEALARRYLDGRTPLLEARVAGGAIRDGHGDLLADDVFCLDDGPRILDCIEFDDHLRHGDVVADVAFLAMDLERVGAPDLAARFLDWYREFAGTVFPTSLADHYVAYRAHVRAKVACLRVAQGDEGAAGDAVALHALTYEHLCRAAVRLVLVGGAPGTGKSTLAAGIADERGWTTLRSDELRKDQAGLGHTARATDGYRRGIYGDEATAATYTALLERARTLLGLGESVVLDASWSDARWREAARAVAHETVADLVELECTAPPGVRAARIRARAAADTDASDADEVVAARMAADAAPWPEANAVDTDAPLTKVVARALTRL